MDMIPKDGVRRKRSELRAYQRDEIDRLNTGVSRLLAWQPGAGKTAAALHRVADAFAKGEASKVLLVSTPTIIRSTWKDEIGEWSDTSGITYVPMLGTAAKREKIFAAAITSPAPCVIAIGFDSVHTLPDYAFDILIVDEASLARSVSSRRFRSLIKIAAKARQRIMMTGSPAPNRVTDIFGVIALVDLGKALGSNYRAFLEQHTVKWGDKDWQRREKPGARHEILEQIKHLASAIRTEDVVDIPELTRHVIEVELPEKAQAIYDSMEQLAIDAISATAVHRDATLIKLQQISNGFLYDENGVEERIHEAKLDAAADIVEQAMGEGEAVMLVYSFAADLRAIRKRFKHVEVLGGPDATGTPETLVPRWSAGEIDILAINPRAAGHGLNLQKNLRCSTQLWLSGTWSAELYEQTVARLHRPGQRNRINVYVIAAAGTIDAAVIRVLDGKVDAQLAVMMALKARAAERKKPNIADEIREARKAAARAHPDAGGSAEAFRAAWARYQELVEQAR
jgi:SNF2 family DNA or RNA helicase